MSDKEYQLSGATFDLRRSDGQGDSGYTWDIYNIEDSKKANKYIWEKKSKAGLIKIGYGIRIGSSSARTYSYQDWWQCSGVCEILETSEKDKSGEYSWVKFRTNNSTYTASGR